MSQKKEENKLNKLKIVDREQEPAGINREVSSWQSLLTRGAHSLPAPSFALHLLQNPRQIGERQYAG